MIRRTTLVEDVQQAIDQVRDDLKGEPVDLWLAFDKNVALINERNDVGLFEYRNDGTYTLHCFFHSRGRDAVQAARELLDYAFNETPVKITIGFTPVDKKGAMWLCRHVGFDILGYEDIDGREHMISTMTRKKWNELASRR